jgi:hypothetical protein
MKYVSVICLFVSLNSYAQKKDENPTKNKIFITAGYGLAGSFFATGFQESLPFSSVHYRAFFNKRFVGSAQNVSIGFRLNKPYEIKAGINFQHFSKRAKATDTLRSVVIYLDNTIHYRDYMYYASIDRVLEKKKNLFSLGLGLYYLRSQDESIEYGTGIPDFYVNKEYNFQNSNEEEGGVFIEFSYEYKFQPRVSLGIRSQFYYTMSLWASESITLFPFIKISL